MLKFVPFDKSNGVVQIHILIMINKWAQINGGTFDENPRNNNWELLRIMI